MNASFPVPVHIPTEAELRDVAAQVSELRVVTQKLILAADRVDPALSAALRPIKELIHGAHWQFVTRNSIKGDIAVPDNGLWVNRRYFFDEYGAQIFISQFRSTGKWACSCKAWVTRRKCKHLTARNLA